MQCEISGSQPSRLQDCKCLLWCAGESRDTADMGLISKFLGEKLVPARRRAALFRTWGAGIGMLPVGGDAVWGNISWAPDDTEEMRANNYTFGYTHLSAEETGFSTSCVCACQCALVFLSAEVLGMTGEPAS